MKKIKVFILIITMSLLLTGCSIYMTEVTEIYAVEQYKIHDTGVEIWAKSETGEDSGFFVNENDVYSCEESSRVVAIRYRYSDGTIGKYKGVYLYLNETDHKEYIKEKYDIE